MYSFQFYSFADLTELNLIMFDKLINVAVFGFSDSIGKEFINYLFKHPEYQSNNFIFSIRNKFQ
jgi:hypothetical protein